MTLQPLPPSMNFETAAPSMSLQAQPSSMSFAAQFPTLDLEAQPREQFPDELLEEPEPRPAPGMPRSTASTPMRASR